MYRKEVNERSPLRIFEKSTHGGLGRGNVGVVISRAGVGKTAFLVDVALDDAMRKRKVLHMTVNNTVEAVRNFYDKMFVELAKSTHLEHPDEVRLMVEQNRHIHSYKDVSFSVDRMVGVARFLRDHADFKVDAVLVDNFPFASSGEEEMRAVKQLAEEMDCEVWLSALSHLDTKTNELGYPDPVEQFDPFLTVKIYLDPTDDYIRLRLLKDHDSKEVDEMGVDLDPTTLLLKSHQTA